MNRSLDVLAGVIVSIFALLVAGGFIALMIFAWPVAPLVFLGFVILLSLPWAAVRLGIDP